MNDINLLEKQVFDARKKLSTKEQIMVSEYIDNNSVNPIAAWLLWLFLGQFGAHRFLFKKRYAILMLILEIIGLATSIILIGLGVLFAVFIWWIVDAFSIQKWIKESRLKAAYKGIMQVSGKTVESLIDIDSSDLNTQQSSESVKPQKINDDFKKQSFNITDGDETNFSKPNE